MGKRILVLGAGRSSLYLIDYLLKHAYQNKWYIVVGDYNKEKIIVDDIQPDVMLEDRPELIEAFFNAGIRVLYPDWHLYTKGMDRFAIPFSNWLEIPELL